MNTNGRNGSNSAIASDVALDGIDTSLIDEMLAMTPEERLRTHDAALRCVLELRQAMGVPVDDDPS